MSRPKKCKTDLKIVSMNRPRRTAQRVAGVHAGNFAPNRYFRDPRLGRTRPWVGDVGEHEVVALPLLQLPGILYCRMKLAVVGGSGVHSDRRELDRKSTRLNSSHVE